MQILQVYVPVTESQVQASNRECTWANRIGGARWDRVREVCLALVPRWVQLLSEVCQQLDLSNYVFCFMPDLSGAFCSNISDFRQKFISLPAVLSNLTFLHKERRTGSTGPSK